MPIPGMSQQEEEEMSFFRKLGTATGLLVEVEDEDSKGALPKLSPEEQAEAQAALEAELEGASPKMPPLRKPSARQGPSTSALAPEEIRRIVEDEIAAAAAPAYALYQRLDEQFAGTIKDPAQRSVLVIGAMQATNGFTPSHVLFDLIEALKACEGVRAEIEGGRDAEIAEQVDGLEADASAKSIEAARLRAEADRLDAEAQAQVADAAARRTSIMASTQAAVEFVQERIAALSVAKTSLETRNPGITPEEPPGNVRSQ